MNLKMMHNTMSNIQDTAELDHQSNEKQFSQFTDSSTSRSQYHSSSTSHIAAAADNHIKLIDSSTSASGYPRLSTSYIEAAAAAVAADSSEKKRKRAVKENNADDGVVDEVKQLNRLAANRRSAALSRQRKRDLIENLQQTVAKLSKENLELRRKCELLEQALQRHQNLPFHHMSALKNHGNDVIGGNSRFSS